MRIVLVGFLTILSINAHSQTTEELQFFFTKKIKEVLTNKFVLADTIENHKGKYEITVYADTDSGIIGYTVDSFTAEGIPIDVNTDLWSWPGGDFDTDPRLVLDSINNFSRYIDLTGVPKARKVSITFVPNQYDDIYEFVISYK